MATLSLIIKSPKGKTNLDKLVQPHHPKALAAMANVLTGLAAGAIRGEVTVQTATADPVAASATITCATVVQDNTVTIGGITFTARNSPTTEIQFAVGASDTQCAASLAEKINAHSTLSAVIFATSALGVVTITSRVLGVVGNFITLARVGAPITLSAAALAGGTGGPSGAATQFKR